MGVVVDFADKALRKKITDLLKQADAKMEEYLDYRDLHLNAAVGSNERAIGLAMYKRYQELTEEAMQLSPSIKGAYRFVSKHVVLSRTANALTSQDGGLTINTTGCVSVDLTNELSP